jgi:hypothetical protein
MPSGCALLWVQVGQPDARELRRGHDGQRRGDGRLPAPTLTVEHSDRNHSSPSLFAANGNVFTLRLSLRKMRRYALNVFTFANKTRFPKKKQRDNRKDVSLVT